MPSVAASVALGAAAQESPRPGPPEIRDEHIFAQLRMTLPATTPDPLPPGSWSVRGSGLWSNSFSWAQSEPGETPEDRRYLVDGETAAIDLTVSRGLTRDLDGSIGLPLRWRGGGRLDGLISGWHDLLGIVSGDRQAFVSDAFRVEGSTEDGGAFAWQDPSGQETGWGLGNAELAFRLRLTRDPRATLALVSRVGLPTASHPYPRSTAFGLQLIGASTLNARFTAFGGFGLAVESNRRIAGVEYLPARLSGFLALEARLAPALAAVVETNLASRLIANVDSYPGLHWLVNTSAVFSLSPRLHLEIGMTENILDQGCTTDVAFFAALRRGPGRF